MSKSAGTCCASTRWSSGAIDPLAFRYLFLTAHYRQQQDFSWEAMDQAAAALRRLRMAAATARAEAVRAGQVPADVALPETDPGRQQRAA